MAYIKVDHSKFSTTADAIDKYIETMKKRMKGADGEISNLSLTWRGNDYIEFKKQWDKVTDGESTYSEMIKALEAYSQFLLYAGEKYRNAQIHAVNRANGLPKY